MTLRAVDVMGFAGSMAAGVDQAGFDVIAKREPTKFDGFGVESMTYNMPWVEAQVAAPEAWDLPSEPVELAFGCPPCSGFSALSIINTKVHGTTYGIDDPINECMTWWSDYAARVKPEIAVMESVALVYRNGLPWLEHVWQNLVDKSGVDYFLTHVVMNAALVGGDVVRPRYFLVASRHPFGVGLEFVSPRPMSEVLADLPAEPESGDHDWGHETAAGAGVARNAATIAYLRANGMDWRAGTRLPDNLPPEWMDDPETMPEEMRQMWRKPRPSRATRWANADGMAEWYSHLRSTDAFSPVMWRPEKPFGVVVAATLFRALRYDAGRNFTYREAARFMSLPDTWSLRVLVEKDKAAELGKAVPTASAKWVAHWARMAVEGTPGEYAGRATANPRIRTIDVRGPGQVAEIRTDDDLFWPKHSDPDPALWLVDRRQRPSEWWQREDELGIFAPAREARVKAGSVTPPPRAASSLPRKREAPTESRPAPRGATTIERVPPETVASFLEELGLSRADAAARLGISVSRVTELTTDRRPNSWLNVDRWPGVQEALRG